MSQMTFRGSRDDTWVTKSHSPVPRTFSMIESATSWMLCSTELTIRGLKAAETIRRNRACRGSSMLIIDPKNSRNSWGMSKIEVADCPEQNSSGCRLISTMSW